MKFLKKKNLIVNHFDAHKFRGKNFFKEFRDDDKKNLFKFSKFCIKRNIACRICGSNKIDKEFLKISTKYYLRKCINCEFVFPNIDCKKIKNYEKRIYSEYDKSNLSTSEKKK